MTDANRNKLKIDFEPIGKRVMVAPGTCLLEAARQAGLMLNSTCGGIGKCGQCRLTVIDGEVSDPTRDERALLGASALAAGERLACHTRAYSGVKVNVPATSLVGKQRLQLNGEDDSLAPDPKVKFYSVCVPPPTLEDTRSDLERIAPVYILQKDKGGYTADPAVLRQFSPLARANDWIVDVFVRDDEIIGAAPSDVTPLGVAVDLGTTKIAAVLVDLKSGEELAVAGAANPQIAYGEDVISRLTYARQHDDGAEILGGSVRNTLDNLLKQLAEQIQAERQQIVDICVVGNTAMTHLLLGLPTSQLSVSPYVAATHLPMDIKARDLGMHAAPGAYVHVLPGIGGFVGADHVAMIMASRLDRANDIALGIDIGTNTEIVLVNPKNRTYICASCASGPAFEGAHIGDGMRASSGAIESVTISPDGIQLKTIDDAPAIGLCGSGIVDVLAELIGCNALSKVGRLGDSNKYIRKGANGLEFLLAAGSRSGSGRDVVISQKDISQIQLAKGAIRAGLETLLAVADTPAEKVAEVVVAGAFGAFLDIRNAFRIGLLPHLPNARYSQVGNAALVGAKRAVLSTLERERAVNIAKRATHLELSTYPNFNRLFALGMQFPEDE
jgi:uncharacterized 2Fe-2S/4Fe-4S cluster protein (DUF4445 family)